MAPDSHSEICTPRRVYCAGPLFNQAERDEMTAIADALCKDGFAVYLPHRDGMEFRHVHHVLVEQGWPAAVAAHFLHEAIFALDIHQLVDACSAVVWNLNGRTPDEGAVSEAAIAWTLGKPLVAYKDDVRSLITGRDNPLLAGLVWFRVLDNLAEIPVALRRAIATDRTLGRTPGALPDNVRRAADRGAELWDSMQKCGAAGDNTIIAEVITRLFAENQRTDTTDRPRCTTR